jgi:hypothetical protein
MKLDDEIDRRYRRMKIGLNVAIFFFVISAVCYGIVAAYYAWEWLA